MQREVRIVTSEQLTPPGTQLASPAPSEALGDHAGGFSLSEQAQGKKAFVTPTDKVTGLPYPIMPDQKWLPLHRPNVADDHHHFHPGSHPLLKSVGGAALRNCRLQRVALKPHNYGPDSYHAYFVGPNIPTDPVDQFKTCVYACAGFIPQYGIDMSDNGPQVIELLPGHIKALRRSNPNDSFGYRDLWYNYEPLRKFFTNFALQQDFNLIERRMLSKFLMTTDEQHKEHLTRKLISAAARLAVDPMIGEYRELHKTGQLHPRMDADPSVLVYFKIRNKPVPRNLLPRVERKVRATLAA